ncbi:MAG: hypothetical protein U0930_11035 [Pirellulales bacterium]
MMKSLNLFVVFATMLAMGCNSKPQDTKSDKSEDSTQTSTSMSTGMGGLGIGTPVEPFPPKKLFSENLGFDLRPAFNHEVHLPLYLKDQPDVSWAEKIGDQQSERSKFIESLGFEDGNNGNNWVSCVLIRKPELMGTEQRVWVTIQGSRSKVVFGADSPRAGRGASSSTSVPDFDKVWIEELWLLKPKQEPVLLDRIRSTYLDGTSIVVGFNGLHTSTEQPLQRTNDESFIEFRFRLMPGYDKCTDFDQEVVFGDDPNWQDGNLHRKNVIVAPVDLKAEKSAEASLRKIASDIVRRKQLLSGDLPNSKLKLVTALSRVARFHLAENEHDETRVLVHADLYLPSKEDPYDIRFLARVAEIWRLEPEKDPTLLDRVLIVKQPAGPMENIVFYETFDELKTRSESPLIPHDNFEGADLRGHGL